MTQLPRPSGSRYGPEAIQRLEAGFSMVYDDDDSTLVEEFPDGWRFAIRVEPTGVIVHVRELMRVVPKGTPASELHVLAGPNGSGKSTFTR